MPEVIFLSPVYGKRALIVYSHRIAISEAGMGLKQIPTFEIDCVTSGDAPQNNSLDAVSQVLTRDLTEGSPFNLTAGN